MVQKQTPRKIFEVVLYGRRQIVWNLQHHMWRDEMFAAVLSDETNMETSTQADSSSSDVHIKIKYHFNHSE